MRRVLQAVGLYVKGKDVTTYVWVVLLPAYAESHGLARG
jgi:hypothetical protein